MKINQGVFDRSTEAMSFFIHAYWKIQYVHYMYVKESDIKLD